MLHRGFIFDFNGTLFWDTQYHDKAWKIFAKKYGLNITNKFLREELHGKVNRQIFKIVLGSDLDDDRAFDLSEEKESIYRNIVNDLKNGPALAKGVEELLNTLKAENIPMVIATSSSKSNVDFYKTLFNLKRWFTDDRIIYDDGTFHGKPAPDIFLISAEKLNLKPADCVVFEDSVNGIKAAKAAGMGKIYLVSSGNHLAWDKSDSSVQVIEDFTELSLMRD